MFQGGQIYERLTKPQKICAFVFKQILHGSQLNLLLKLHDTFPEHVVCIHQVLNGLAGMYDGGVVPSSKMFPDGFERVLGKNLCQIHGDLTGLYNFPFPGLLQIGRAHV